MLHETKLEFRKRNVIKYIITTLMKVEFLLCQHFNQNHSSKGDLLPRKTLKRQQQQQSQKKKTIPHLNEIPEIKKKF